jgi:hypothetical protein
MNGLCTIPDVVNASLLVKTVFRVLSLSNVGHNWSAKQGWMGKAGTAGGVLGAGAGRGHAIACPNLSTIVRFVRTIRMSEIIVWVFMGQDYPIGHVELP